MTKRNPYKTGDFEDTSMSLQLAINHNLELQKRICELETELAAARKECDLLRKMFALATRELPKHSRERLYDMLVKGSVE